MSAVHHHNQHTNHKVRNAKFKVLQYILKPTHSDLPNLLTDYAATTRAADCILM